MTREETIKELIKQQLRKAAPKLKGYKVVLFGSRVTGKARDRSDFDVGIVGDRPVGLRTFYEIEDLLESIETLYQIDLVDLNRAAPALRREALKAVEPLYDG
ncbi:nucleotidyltransferase domain-containing protein [Anaerobaca lacustris]|uniref:Nucleotidyltransferase domain-containing protein n=1 Tax=Anaerobaca lacustris TaxID=3044600 RepID=A0AAW6TRH2_9BACT|nr:nucleotidyltransferase domain-containing protein [Sedimentisphaerales bacterium M17dextr]